MFNFDSLMAIATFGGGILLALTLLSAAVVSYKVNRQRALYLLLAGILILLIAIRDFWPAFLPPLFH